MNVLILHDELPPDARPDELDVFTQVRAIGAALEALGHRGSAAGVTLDLAALQRRLCEAPACDVVVNLVESLARRMRLAPCVPALLDALGVPYTGVPTEGLFLTCGKTTAKRHLAQCGIATPSWVEEGGGEADPSAPFAPGKYIVKSVWEHASLGLDDDAIVEVSTADELRRVIRSRRDRLGGEAFAEAYINGREFNLALLESAPEPTAPRRATVTHQRGVAEVLPPAEITFVDYVPGKPKIVGYAAKWAEDSFEYHRTPRGFAFPPEDAALVRRLRELALRCWDVFRLRGYARVDFRVDERGTPWVLEINANPCLSPDAGYMAAAAEAGLTFRDVVDRLLHAAVAR
ncbi:MAG: D-alanine--D-alanine ligase [Phycisphaerae bacterium]|nr:D-alanine--D-alanine ligase [Phycisphaerae bacterium]